MNIKKTFLWICFGCGIFCITVILALLLPGFSFMFFTPAQQAGQLSACSANIKSIVTAIEMYKEDYGGLCPESLTVLVEPSTPGGGRYMGELLVCPACNKPYIYSFSEDSYIITCGEKNCHLSTGKVDEGYFPRFDFKTQTLELGEGRVDEENTAEIRSIIKMSEADSTLEFVEAFCNNTSNVTISYADPESIENAKEAIEALLAMNSILEIGINYSDYLSRLADAKIPVDKFLRDSEGIDPELKDNIEKSLTGYKEAYTWWERLVEDPGESPYTGYVPAHDPMFEEIVSIFPDMTKFLKDNGYTKTINIGEKYSMEGCRQALWYYAGYHAYEADRIYKEKYK